MRFGLSQGFDFCQKARKAQITVKIGASPCTRYQMSTRAQLFDARAIAARAPFQPDERRLAGRGARDRRLSC